MDKLKLVRQSQTAEKTAHQKLLHEQEKNVHCLKQLVVEKENFVEACLWKIYFLWESLG